LGQSRRVKQCVHCAPESYVQRKRMQKVRARWRREPVHNRQ
jgi:hypothetical protein